MNPEAEQEWRALACGLAEKLSIGDTALRRAFAETPRHVFVPRYYVDGPDYRPVTSTDPQWLPGVYSDEALTTQIGDTPLGSRPTSSSSQPALMAAMLDALELTDGLSALEIGTGTGYNAALLSHRLGAANVTSIDIDPELVAAARDRLSSPDMHPSLLVGDGTFGAPDHAPYDRVIATHAVERIPYAWIEQTRPGGIILADVRSLGAPAVGHLARLTVRADGTASGDFAVGVPGNFMPDRGTLTEPHYSGPSHFDLRDATARVSRLGAEALAETGFALALWNRLPDFTVRHGEPLSLSTPDSSWALVPHHAGKIQVSGPRDLWQAAEETHTAWLAAGRPGVADYSITVTTQGQRIAPA